MRLSVSLSILFFLISCQSKTDSVNNLDDYSQGIKILETIGNNGEIDYTKALDFFEKSYHENPNHIESSFWKMQCEIKLGNLDKALETSKTVTNRPNFMESKLIPHFYITIGLVEKIKGNIEKSTDYFSMAIEIYNSRIDNDINDTDAILNKAIILCYLDKKEKAISFIDTISLNKEQKPTLEQIRNDIIIFDSEKIIDELKEGRK